MKDFHEACVINDTRTIFLHLQKKQDPNAYDENGITPLNTAVQNRNLEAARLLINNGADINKKNESGLTALHIAALHGNMEIIELLFAQEEPLHTEERWKGRTPAELAKEYDREQAWVYIMKNGNPDYGS